MSGEQGYDSKSQQNRGGASNNRFQQQSRSTINDHRHHNRRSYDNNNYHNNNYYDSRTNNASRNSGQNQGGRNKENQNKLTNKDQQMLTDVGKSKTESGNAPLYSQQMSTLSNASSSIDSHIKCVCCLHDLNTYVSYSCLHYVCLQCAIKMRILCDKHDCPICRQLSDFVICTKEQLIKQQEDYKKLSFDFANQKLDGGFYYENEVIKDEYVKLLSNICKRCSKSESFDKFEDLYFHMKREHKLFYCDLCIDHVKLLPFERKYYNREDLARHRRSGDPEDSSFKGHPLCEFCDNRYFDGDDLFRHYRKDHYYCHFCDADGCEEYYGDYSELRKHFLKSHFLCELDECASKGPETREYSVFRSDVDLKAHKVNKHAKSKSDAKSLGKINIEFNVSNSVRDRIRQRTNPSSAGASAVSASASSLIAEPEQDSRRREMRSTDRRPQQHQQQPQQQRQQHQQQQHQQQQQPQQQQSQQQRQQQQKRAYLRELYQEYAETDEKTETKPTADLANSKPNVDQAAKATATAAAVTPRSWDEDEYYGSIIISEADTVNKLPMPSSQQLQLLQQQQQQKQVPKTSWRDLISSGSAPTMNVDSEFPTLGGDTDSKPMPTSLSALGDFIAKTSVWNKKTTETTQQQQQQQQKQKPSPRKESAKAEKQSTRNKTDIDSKMTNLKQFLGKPDAVYELKRDDDSEEEIDLGKSSEGKKKKKAKNKNKKEEKTETNQVRTKTPDSETNKKVVEKPETVEMPTTKVTTPLSAPPPGFSKIASVAEPVAAAAISIQPTPSPAPPPPPPPPGFSTKKIEENTEQTKQLNDIIQNYTKPLNYEKRNQELTVELSKLFNEKSFDKFKQLSIDFRNNKLNSSTYLKQSRDLLINQENIQRFFDLIQDMIVLLPDVQKQNELYESYLKQLGEHSKQQKPTKLAWAEKDKQKESVNRISKCLTCSQLFLTTELPLHSSLMHGNQSKDNEFPALGNGSKQLNTMSDLPSFHTPQSIIFNNPNESLSLVNKRKEKYKKYLK